MSLEEYFKSIIQSNFEQDYIYISLDILGNPFISNVRLADTSKKGLLNFLQEEYFAFGNWDETCSTMDKGAGWYSIKLIEHWNFEHTECDIEVKLNKKGVE